MEHSTYPASHVAALAIMFNGLCELPPTALFVPVKCLFPGRFSMMLSWPPFFLIEVIGTDEWPGRTLPVLLFLGRIPVSSTSFSLLLDMIPTSIGRFDFARVALVDWIGLMTSRFVYLDTREAVPPPAWDDRV